MTVYKPTAEEIKQILDDHRKWLYGSGGKRAIDTPAILTSVDLTNADLRGADLSSAVLRGAILTSADLTGADLTSADLRGADLTSAIGSQLVLARTEIVPREGEIYGWKKCYGPMCESRIVKLRIPAEARRSNALGRKCRAEFADVLSIESVDAKTKYETAISIHDSSFEYALGKRVQCREWNTNRLHECSGGIHFYLTREEAEAHY